MTSSLVAVRIFMLMLTMMNMAKMTIATYTPVAEAVARSSLTASSSTSLSAIKTVVPIVVIFNDSDHHDGIIIMINVIMIIICFLIPTETARPSSPRRLRLQADNPGDLLRSILIVLGELITVTISSINIIMHLLVEHPGCESEAHNPGFRSITFPACHECHKLSSQC